MKLVVGFSRSKKKFPIGSWFIRMYQGFTPYSHIYLRIKYESNFSDTIVHASSGCVHKMSNEEFNQQHETIEEFEIQVPFRYVENPYRRIQTKLNQLILDTIHRYSGSEYGIMQNFGIVIVDFCRIFNKKIQNPSQKGWNCSEFVLFILMQIDLEQFEGIDLNTVTPKQLYTLLKRMNKEGNYEEK